MTIHNVAAAVDDSALTGTLTFPSAPVAILESDGVTPATLVFRGHNAVVEGVDTLFKTGTGAQKINAGDLVELDTFDEWKHVITNELYEVRSVDSDTQLTLKALYRTRADWWYSGPMSGTAKVARYAGRAVSASGGAFTTEVHAAGTVGPSDIAGAEAWIQLDADGIMMEVESVTDDDNLVLKHPYYGAAAAPGAGTVADAAHQNTDEIIDHLLAYAEGDTILFPADVYDVGNAPRYKTFSSNLTFSTGSKAVSAASANTFITAGGRKVVVPGQFIQLNADAGVWVEVGSVTDDQNLVLVSEYPGLAVAAGAATVDYDIKVMGVNVSKSWSESLGVQNITQIPGQIAKSWRSFEVSNDVTVEGSALDGSNNPTTILTTHPGWIGFGFITGFTGPPWEENHQAWVVHKGLNDVVQPTFSKIGFNGGLTPVHAYAPAVMDKCKFYGAGLAGMWVSVDRRISHVYASGDSGVGVVRTRLLECKGDTNQIWTLVVSSGTNALDFHNCVFTMRGHGLQAYWGLVGSPFDVLDLNDFIDTRAMEDVTIENTQFLRSAASDRAIAFVIQSGPLAQDMKDFRVKDNILDLGDNWFAGSCAMVLAEGHQDVSMYDIYFGGNTIKNVQPWNDGPGFIDRAPIGMRDVHITGNILQNYSSASLRGFFIRGVSDLTIDGNDYTASNLDKFADDPARVPIFIINCDEVRIAEPDANFPVEAPAEEWVWVIGGSDIRISGAKTKGKPDTSAANSRMEAAELVQRGKRD